MKKKNHAAYKPREQHPPKHIPSVSKPEKYGGNKKDFKVYKLHFTSALHINSVRDDYSVSLHSIASDTMQAALMACMARLGMKIPENGDLGFSISNLFPFYQKEENDQAVYFLPRPLTSSIYDPKDAAKRKTIKKVEWIDSKLMDKVLFKTSLVKNDADVGNYVQGSFLTGQKIDKDFITTEEVERVTVSRDFASGGNVSTPFYMERIYFKDRSGLYFIAEGDCELLDKALSLLAVEGIGTDRNVGQGRFDYSTDTISFGRPAKSDYAYSLSTFIPESKQQLEQMLADDRVGYSLLRRGGWITTEPQIGIRKNAIYAFDAGSVFAWPTDGVQTAGRIVDLRPEAATENHPIWRNGKTILLPIKV